jgi:hypothetical protein
LEVTFGGFGKEAIFESLKSIGAVVIVANSFFRTDGSRSSTLQSLAKSSSFYSTSDDIRYDDNEIFRRKKAITSLVQAEAGENTTVPSSFDKIQLLSLLTSLREPLQVVVTLVSYLIYGEK